MNQINQDKDKYKSGATDTEDHDEIIDEVEELHKNRPSLPDPLLNSDNNAAAVSGGISSSGANAIDHSIDTLQLEQYDYVEEVRMNW